MTRQNAELFADPMQTAVVHVEQLNPETMAQLSEQGFRAVRDPDLVIFVRRVPASEAAQLGASNGRNADETTAVMNLPR
jgi:hypothetical protein